MKFPSWKSLYSWVECKILNMGILFKIKLKRNILTEHNTHIRSGYLDPNGEIDFDDSQNKWLEPGSYDSVSWLRAPSSELRAPFPISSFQGGKVLNS